MSTMTGNTMNSIETDPRRHDLDALRAFAMLLGIALHAALSFMDTPWVVQDQDRVPAMGWFVSAIHGFRMPLFFVLSGFFTAMLWRKRGTRGLIRHRARRIGLPLMYGCATVVPAMWLVLWWTSTLPMPANTSAIDSSKDIWTASAFGNMDALRSHVEHGAEIDGIEPIFHHTALGWAALCNQEAAVEFLLNAGASPSARYSDNNTALHSAAFLGRADIAEKLIAFGADVNARNTHGETPLDSLRHDQGTTEYIAGLLNIPIDYSSVSAGRERIREMLLENYAFSGLSTGAALAEQGEADIAGQPGGFAKLVNGMMQFPFFHHLWFLWFLCILIAGFAFVVAVLRYVPRFEIPAVYIATPLCLLWLVPLCMFAQGYMHMRGTIPGFGPDTSVGLIPVPHVLLFYAIFFGFGALMYGVPGAAKRISRYWWLQLPLAVVLAPVTLELAFQTPWGRELAGNEPMRQLLSNLGQVLYAWLMIFGLMGLFGKVLNRERYAVRYVSDSSYWLYLVHLPLIIVGQALVRNLDWPAGVKIGLLIGITTVILLISYRAFVRYTWVGRLLNGPRVRPERGIRPQPEVQSCMPGADVVSH